MTKLDLYNIPINDEKTFELLGEGLTAGVFQLENKSLGARYSSHLKPKSIEEIAAIIALIRPGSLNSKMSDGKSVTEHYEMRHLGQEESTPIIKEVGDLLKNTHDLMIFQEQTLIIAKELAGFDGSMAMKLQKGISKKKAEIINELRPKFVEGCVKNGIAEKDAIYLYDIIEASNRYSFNLCTSYYTTVQRKKKGSNSFDICSISEVKVGDKVYGPNGFVKVLKVIDCGVLNCVHVVFNDTSLVCTLNHRLMTNHGVKTVHEIIDEGHFVLTNLRGFQAVKSYSYIDQVPCFDLEVDSEDHLFYQNGLVGHNSHSIGYSYISYEDAYCKANYPIEFFIATLRINDDFDYIRKIVEDCAKLGIRVKPPTLQKPCITFTEFEGQIYYGFSNIKGIGEAKAQDLVETFPTPPISWYECLCRMTSLGKTLVQNSIKAGVFSYLKVPTRKMLDDFSNLQLLSGGEMKFVKENWANYSDFSGLFKGVLGVCQTKRRPQVQSVCDLIEKPAETLEDNLDDIIKYQNELLGVPLSYDLIDTVQRLGNATIEDYLSGYSKKEFRIVAQIEEVKVITVKKGKNEGRNMAFINIKDQTGQMEAVIFSDAYDEFGGFLKEGTLQTLVGVRGKQFIINEVEVRGGF